MAFIGPAHINILGWQTVSRTSGTYIRNASSSSLTGGYGTVGSGPVNNYAAWDVPLMAGTWTITILRWTAPDQGVATFSLDGVDLAPTVDTYSAGFVLNTVTQFTGVSVASGGIKEFRVRCDSKNASSSGYYYRTLLITFTNTDAPTQSFTCAGPSRFDIIPYGYWGQSAGTSPGRTQTSTALSGGYLTQSDSASNELGWYVPLTAGTWALDLIYATGTNTAILTTSIDGSTVATVDTYNGGGLTLNNVSTTTGIAVARSKFALLKVATPTKNASSSAYIPRIQHIALRKTA